MPLTNAVILYNGVRYKVEHEYANGMLRVRNGRYIRFLQPYEFEVLDAETAPFQCEPPPTEPTMEDKISSDSLIDFIAKCPDLTIREKIELNALRLIQLERRRKILSKGEWSDES